jgi:hypothetical protein
MSWNTSFLLAEGISLQDMKRVIPDTYHILDKTEEQTVSWDEACSFMMADSLALTEFSGWGWIVSPVAGFLIAAAEVAAAQRGRVVSLGFYGSSGGYAFSLFRDGKEARSFVRKGEDISKEKGASLPEEQDLDWSDGEAALMKLGSRVLGFSPFGGADVESLRFMLAVPR